MSIDVKPLTRWIIHRGYKVRFRQRTLAAVTGILTTPSGEIEFTYTPTTRMIQCGGERIQLNEYGWEIPPNNSEET